MTKSVKVAKKIAAFLKISQRKPDVKNADMGVQYG